MKSEFRKCDQNNDATSLVMPHRFYQHAETLQETRMFPSPGSLLKQFTAEVISPSELNMTKVVNCSFSPSDDNMLVVSVLLSGTKAGYVQLWDLEGDDEDNFTRPIPVSDNFFTYSAVPPCQFSSSGELISAVLNNSVCCLTILAIDEENEFSGCDIQCDGVLSPSNNFLRGRVRCCVFSQDNQRAVIVTNEHLNTRLQHNNSISEVSIWRAKSRHSVTNIWKGTCQAICQEFTGDVHSCVLSPNGDYLAMSSSSGQSFTLDCNTFKTICTTNCSCFTEATSVKTLLFNPQFECELLCCHSNTWCCYHGLESGICSEGKSRRISQDESVSANACTFSPDGELLAIALSNSSVVLCGAESFQELFAIKPSFLPLVSERGAFSVSISSSCQELAVGYDGGLVCVWQLPIKLDLKHICRLAILKMFSPRKIPLLPLPRKLKSYLLHFHGKHSLVLGNI